MKLTPYLLLAGAFIGIGDTLFLSYYQYLNLIPSCALAGCDVVLGHELSKFFGVPWGYLGLVYYAFAAFLAFFLAVDPFSKGLRSAMLLYATIGVACSAVFIFYIQMTLIGAICLYCAISAGTTLALFIFALWHFLSTRSSQVDYQQSLMGRN